MYGSLARWPILFSVDLVRLFQHAYHDQRRRHNPIAWRCRKLPQVTSRPGVLPQPGTALGALLGARVLLDTQPSHRQSRPSRREELAQGKPRIVGSGQSRCSWFFMFLFFFYLRCLIYRKARRRRKSNTGTESSRRSGIRTNLKLRPRKKKRIKSKLTRSLNHLPWKKSRILIQHWFLQQFSNMFLLFVFQIHGDPASLREVVWHQEPACRSKQENPSKRRGLTLSNRVKIYVWIFSMDYLFHPSFSEWRPCAK